MCYVELNNGWEKIQNGRFIVIFHNNLNVNNFTLLAR